MITVFPPVCLCPHLLFYVQRGCSKVKGTYSFRGASKVTNSPLCRKDVFVSVYVYPCYQMQKETLVYSCMVWEEALQVIYSE